jgi:hypothetical protein|nr:MAG TPA: hypothetical protein [Caudoviricetes sp.]
MNLEEVLNKAIEKAVKEAILRAHPVGSYFISDEGTNPDVVLFGSYGGGVLHGKESEVGFSMVKAMLNPQVL